MGELKIKIPNEIEQRFRKAAMHRFGFMKGAISQAAKEAIEEWTEEEIETEPTTSFDELRGALKHVKKTSVELQHEAWNPIRKKYSKNVNRR